ncbi:MAG: helix-hairpin-helix domain-containing protein [Halanaerobiales bacterium]
MFHFKKDYQIIIGVILLLMGFVAGYFVGESKEENISADLSENINLNSVNNEKINYQKNITGEQNKNELKDEIILVVYITGAVKKPGVYEMEEESRVFELIKKAGGEKTNADLEKINLAETLEDEEQIYIPYIGEEENNSLNSPSVSNTFNNSEKININKADINELEKLNGIGPSKAESIVKYRDNNGKFKSIEQLLDVPGIGPSTLEKIKDELIL